MSKRKKQYNTEKKKQQPKNWSACNLSMYKCMYVAPLLRCIYISTFTASMKPCFLATPRFLSLLQKSGMGQETRHSQRNRKNNQRAVSLEALIPDYCIHCPPSTGSSSTGGAWKRGPTATAQQYSTCPASAEMNSGFCSSNSCSLNDLSECCCCYHTMLEMTYKPS